MSLTKIFIQGILKDDIDANQKNEQDTPESVERYEFRVNEFCKGEDKIFGQKVFFCLPDRRLVTIIPYWMKLNPPEELS